MGNELSVFDFNGMGVRVIKDSGGEPWFVAKDVADILGYSETAMMTRRLDDDETMSAKLAGMNMKSTLINEFGLYNAIIGSNTPESKSFRRWITHDLLPDARHDLTTKMFAAIKKITIRREK